MTIEKAIRDHARERATTAGEMSGAYRIDPAAFQDLAARLGARVVYGATPDPRDAQPCWMVLVIGVHTLTITADATVPRGAFRYEGTTDHRWEDVRPGWQRCLRCTRSRCMIGPPRDAMVRDSADRPRVCVPANDIEIAATPAGRISLIFDLAREGKITADQARQLLEVPAVDAEQLRRAMELLLNPAVLVEERTKP